MKTIDAIAIVAVVQARYFTYRLLMEIIIIVLICAMHTVATETSAVSLTTYGNITCIYCIVEKFDGEKFWQNYFFEHLVKKV